jgi:hypothetical protein
LLLSFEIGLIEVAMNGRCNIVFGLLAFICMSNAALCADEPKAPAVDSAKATPAGDKEADAKKETDADKLVAGDWKIEYVEVLGKPLTFTHEGKTIEPLKDAVLRFDAGEVNFTNDRTCKYKATEKDGVAEIVFFMPTVVEGPRRVKPIRFESHYRMKDGKLEICADVPWHVFVGYELEYVDSKTFTTKENGSSYLLRLVRLTEEEKKRLKPTEVDVFQAISIPLMMRKIERHSKPQDK